MHLHGAESKVCETKNVETSRTDSKISYSSVRQERIDTEHKGVKICDGSESSVRLDTTQLNEIFIKKKRFYRDFLLFVLQLSLVKTYPQADAKQSKTKKWPYLRKLYIAE